MSNPVWRAIIRKINDLRPVELALKGFRIS